ncbi:MAG: outer membrane beta-barrel protein [Bacteroidia bacterium]
MRRLGRPIVDEIFERELGNAEMPVNGRVWSNLAREMEQDRLRRKVGFYRMVAAASILLLLGMGTWMLATQMDLPRPDGNAVAQLRPIHPNLPAFANRRCESVEAGKSIFTSLAPFNSKRSSTGNKIRQWMDSHSILAPAHGSPIGMPALDRLKTVIPAASPTKMESRQPKLTPQVDRRGIREQLPMVPPQNEGILSLIKKQDKEREFTYSLAENEEEDETNIRGWELGAGFSPDMSFSSTTPVQRGAKSTQPLADDPTQANTNRLSPVVAYAAGLNASYNVNERISVRAGLQCMNRQSSTAAPKETFGKTGNTFQSNLDLVSLEVPVTVRYNVLHGDNYDYYVASGMSGNLFLHYDNYLQASDGSIVGHRSSGTADAFKPSQASVLLSTGLRYRLFKDLSLQVEPGMRYGIWSNEYAFSQTKPVSMSLMSGMTYRF